MIVFVTGFPESTVGHGGANRSHQVIHDLRTAFPAEDLVVFCWSEGPRLATADHSYSPPGFRKRVTRKAYNLLKTLINPSKATVLADKLAMQKFNSMPSKDYYDYIVSSNKQKNILSIVGGAQFSDALDINRRRKIPTVLCPQNLESLAAHACRPTHTHRLSSACKSLSVELDAFNRANTTLTISKTEYSLLRGLDIRCDYYPYRPTGTVRELLIKIRERRNNITASSKSILILGTADWGPSAHGLQAVLDCIRNYYVRDASFIIAGQGTERLKQNGDENRGISFLGRLEDSEFNETLSTIAGALVPVTVGFGAITRLADFSCAGIPVVTTQLAANGMNLPPGVTVARDIKDMAAPFEILPNPSLLDEYLDWETRNAPNWKLWQSIAMNDRS